MSMDIGEVPRGRCPHSGREPDLGLSGKCRWTWTTKIEPGPSAPISPSKSASMLSSSHASGQATTTSPLRRESESTRFCLQRLAPDRRKGQLQLPAFGAACRDAPGDPTCHWRGPMTGPSFARASVQEPISRSPSTSLSPRRRLGWAIAIDPHGLKAARIRPGGPLVMARQIGLRLVNRFPRTGFL